MAEIDPLVLSFSHLANFPREKEALHTLQRVASLVKPIMRARGWKVGQLTEFYPDQPNLLGLNVGAGQRICLRLRYPGDRNQFVPIEQVVDTMLHELAHNVRGPHDAKFHALWNQLRDEHESLLMKGYTGEGFLSAGQRLGGRMIPMEEARRLARASAEKRRTLNAGSGQRLGGAAPKPDEDIRSVIVGAVGRRRRNDNLLRGCANDNQTQNEIREIADTATKNGFKTQAEEDAANDAAIAQALWELVQEDEKAKKGYSYIPPSATTQTWANTNGGASTPALGPSRETKKLASRGNGTSTWVCDICTLVNPVSFLCCDACGIERGEKTTQDLAGKSSKRQPTVIDLTHSPSTDKRGASTSKPGSNSKSTSGPTQYPPSAKPRAPTWTCSFCGRVRERQWWSCDICGTIKQQS
ncbi:WLM-domain-containing protein [Jackrogersella minutella]|nr:WLM-domain-containing protein [Jackrogersella minutella]